MTKFKLMQLKNEMLVANFLANFIGVVVVQALIFRAETPLPESLFANPIVYWFDIAFTPFAFLFVTVFTLIYERPIRRYLTARSNRVTLSPQLERLARQRLLNEPFVLIAADFSMWLLASILYPVAFSIARADPIDIQRPIVMNISTGIITVTIAFFLLEHVLQKRLAPCVFPEGGLHKIPKTMRIRIRTRLMALLFACNLIPLFSILQSINRITENIDDPAVALELARSSVFTNGLIFIGVGIVLTVLVSRNLTLPFSEIIQSLRSVKNGNFDKKIQVTTNDEIGYTGDVINEMTEGLKERDRMRHSLGLAMDVQQHLLPRRDPRVDGLDIAGKSIYCEETGGDYFDYLQTGEKAPDKIKVVVGDVSDHGIPSALLMTTARAFLKQRAARSGRLNQIVADVNRQISSDVEESGQFMTLFFCEIDSRNKIIRWVNAGHDPAFVYNGKGGGFDELSGQALPLGVSKKTAYQEYQRRIQPGQIILIGTDGIWESHNADNEMFGKKRFKDIIRAQADKPAKEILDSVITGLDEFRHPLQKEDDVTLVIIKVLSTADL